MFNIPKITLASGLSLALAFTSSCIPNNANEDEPGGGSSEEENSSSSVGGISADNCYWYEDGNGKYDYKCGFEPPCYKDPNCPMCDVCYPYPTECVDNCISRDYKCSEVSDPGKFKLVSKDECCGPSYCYSEGNEPVLCDEGCYPPTSVELKGIKSLLPLYTCYVEKRSSSSSADSSSSDVTYLFEEYGIVLEHAVIYNDYMPCGGLGCESERASICAIQISSITPLPTMKVSANIITSTVNIKNMPFDDIYVYNGGNKYHGNYRPARSFRADSGDEYTMEITVEIHGKQQTTIVQGKVGAVH